MAKKKQTVKGYGQPRQAFLTRLRLFLFKSNTLRYAGDSEKTKPVENSFAGILACNASRLCANLPFTAMLRCIKFCFGHEHKFAP